MTDVNEEIVAKYFELKEYMVYRNLPYSIETKHAPDSDIDLMIYNPKNPKDKAIVEVKGWYTEGFTLNYFKKVSELYNFVRSEALKKAEEFFGDKNFKRILVIPKLPKDQNKKKEIFTYVKTKGVGEVIELEPILKYIFEKIEENKNYRDSEFLQTIRLIKIYKINIPQK